MAKWLSRLGRFSSGHPWVVIVTWLLILAAVVAGAAVFSTPLTSSYSVKGLSSLNTLSKADNEFGVPHNSGDIVFATKDGAKLSSGDEQAIRDLASSVNSMSGVDAAVDPFNSTNRYISPSGEAGIISVAMTGETLPDATADRIVKKIDTAEHAAANLRIAADSTLVPVAAQGSSETIALLIGFAVLFITFGSLLTAGLPLLTAVLGLGIGLEGVYLATSLTPLNSVATVLATLLGLAVGIDYALFIVSRHRRQVRSGMDVRESIALATGTAGSAVLFAAVTVIMALAGLAIIQIDFLTQMGLAGAFAVLVALLISLTLTPALLRLLGTRVLNRRARRQLAAGISDTNPIASGWVRLVTRRPVLFVIGTVALLGVIALPALSMRTTLPNDGEFPTSTQARQAFDMKADAFGEGVNAPVQILATFTGPASEDEVGALTQRIAALKNVSAAIPAGVEGNDALLTILPRTGPSDEGTKTLVEKLRSSSVADNLPGTPELSVTGLTAVDIDISEKVTDAFPAYLGLIAVFAFVLLMIVFRSILVPLKATVGFLLSLVATLGGVTAVFQWGWFASLFHLTPGPLLSFLPVIVTGVLFGLAMDYEMFLVSGMRERVAHGEPAREALPSGFRSAASVVVAAGAMMISVFGSGAFDTDPTTQAIAFALALGVILDVFVVRMTFVPAMLAILGRSAWWFPRWLDRITPDLDVEGSALSNRHGVPVRPDSPAVTS